jgi:hypothetical protein
VALGQHPPTGTGPFRGPNSKRAANRGGLFLLVPVLGLNLLLLLGSRLRRLLNCWRGRILILRFLFREPQPALCHVEDDGALPFKGDFAR